jgi:hypothetical protein
MSILTGLRNLTKQIIKIPSWIKEKNPIDLRDCHIYGGLIMAGIGLYLYSPNIAFTVIGFILFLLGIIAGKVK